MHKVVYEYKVGVRDLFLLTLNERMPTRRFTHCRIDGKEYEISFVHFRGDDAHKMLDAMLKNFAIKAPDGGSFVGKEVKFV